MWGRIDIGGQLLSQLRVPRVQMMPDFRSGLGAPRTADSARPGRQASGGPGWLRDHARPRVSWATPTGRVHLVIK